MGKPNSIFEHLAGMLTRLTSSNDDTGQSHPICILFFCWGYGLEGWTDLVHRRYDLVFFCGHGVGKGVDGRAGSHDILFPAHGRLILCSPLVVERFEDHAAHMAKAIGSCRSFHLEGSGGHGDGFGEAYNLISLLFCCSAKAHTHRSGLFGHAGGGLGRYAHLHLDSLQVVPQSSQILTDQVGGLAYTNHHRVVVHGHLGGNAHTDCQTAYGQGSWVQGSSEDIGIPSRWPKCIRQVTGQLALETAAHRRS
ncbi:MAG: hypothetical protein WC119_09200 [Synergistaceae bacterium]